jgi:hypothetical protein
MNYSHHTMTTLIRLLFCGSLFLPAVQVYADSFTLGEFEGLYNGRFSYGTLYRLRDRDKDLIAIASDGNARTANIDDGNLNYSNGLVSNMVSTTGELIMKRRNFGFYLRASAFYDFENKNNDPARTEFDSDAEKLVGADVELRESYLNWSFAPGGMPMVFRVGQQIINWSETNFVRDGLDLINPVDFVTAFQPTSIREDLRTPQRMVWGAANVSETFSVEAFYQYEWEPVTLPPVGSFFSNLDVVGGEGLQSWMYGSGQVSDLGTDLDQEFGLPADTLGFDADYQRLPGLNQDKPSDLGQYGLALIGIFPDSNATKVGLHYIRYHSRLPLIMGRTGDAAAVAATAEPFVAARASALESIYLGEGVDPTEAALLGRQAAEQLTLSNYANEASFFTTYPEDIDAFGLTFSTSTTGTGTLYAGEFSHHLDYPYQVAIGPVLNAVFSPVLFDTDVGDTPLGDFGPDAVIGGVKRLDRTQATLEVAQIFRGLLGADQMLIGADFAWTRVHDMPGSNEPQLTSGDEDSWGYRLRVGASYSSLFGAINLAPFVSFTHDVDGSTPGPVSTFLEDRKSINVGIGVSYIQRITAELRYSGFFHGGQANSLRDRDFLNFKLSYYL